MGSGRGKLPFRRVLWNVRNWNTDTTRELDFGSEITSHTIFTNPEFLHLFGNDRPSVITAVKGAMNGELDQKNTDSSTHASIEAQENAHEGGIANKID